MVKDENMPKNSKYEAFLDQKRAPGGDTTGHPGKLSKWEIMEPLYPEVRMVS